MHESAEIMPPGRGPVAGLIHALQHLDPDRNDTARIDTIRALEELKAVTAAVQARVTAAFVASQRAHNRSAGVPAERVDRGIASQVGLARRESPSRARRYTGWATILTTELPHTYAQLQAGRIPEWRALLVARETAWLTREHRAVVDRELAPHLESLGDRKTETEAKRLAYRLDPHGYVTRLSQAQADRRVTVRPAPDLMVRLSALLPLTEGIATHTALTQAVDRLAAAGDPRSRGQVMADLLVQRVTGQDTATAVPVEVQIVIDADTLLRNGSEPAQVVGHGPVPGPWARHLILTGNAPRWLRRLYTSPHTGELVAMDSRRHLFTEGQRRFVTARDQVCRTPWCEAPIRHIDHVTPAQAGGPTSISNGQGLCVACNQTKEAPGWQARPEPGGDIVTTTPTGHRYRSRPPDITHQPRSPVEITLRHWLHHAA